MAITGRRYRLNLPSSTIYHMKDTVLITPAHRETWEFVQSYPSSTLEESFLLTTGWFLTSISWTGNLYLTREREFLLSNVPKKS